MTDSPHLNSFDSVVGLLVFEVPELLEFEFGLLLQLPVGLLELLNIGLLDFHAILKGIDIGVVGDSFDGEVVLLHESLHLSILPANP